MLDENNENLNVISSNSFFVENSDALMSLVATHFLLSVVKFNLQQMNKPIKLPTCRYIIMALLKVDFVLKDIVYYVFFGQLIAFFYHIILQILIKLITRIKLSFAHNKASVHVRF